MSFLNRQGLDPDTRILDLGGASDLSQMMGEKYQVSNTPEEMDLDYEYHGLGEGFDVVTAFEILEHMTNPFGVLSEIQAPKLLASVPLNLWFEDTWKGGGGTDKYKWHYHEFLPWQFDMLLEKTHWEIVDSLKVPYVGHNKIGIRPFLRRFYDKYYFVSCVRSADYTPPSA